MLLDAIATIILVGMMLIPIVNVGVGAIAGAALGGVPGAIIGITTAFSLSILEKLIADQLGWWEEPGPQSVGGTFEDAAVTTGGRQARRGRTETPRTQPPSHRARRYRARDAGERTGPAAPARNRRSSVSR